MSRRQRAGIAQLVEQATENRRVPSSNLGPGTFLQRLNCVLKHHLWCFFCARVSPEHQLSRSKIPPPGENPANTKNGMVSRSTPSPRLVCSPVPQLSPPTSEQMQFYVSSRYTKSSKAQLRGKVPSSTEVPLRFTLLEAVGASSHHATHSPSFCV